MALNPPPFQVEDQTDEDFFDKLVDDDFVGPTESGLKFADGSDSDDTKAFSNLTIGDSVNASEDSVGGDSFEAKGKEECVVADLRVVGAHTEERNSLVSSVSLASDGVMEPSNDEIESKLEPEPTVLESNGSGVPAIKEVGWSSFYVDSEQKEGHGFGSYSDFFNDLGDDSGSFLETVGSNFDAATKIKSGSDEQSAVDLSKSIHGGQYQENQVDVASADQSTDGQDLTSSQYWENLYPGWKFDPTTGQWYQIEGADAPANAERSFSTNLSGEWGDVSAENTVSYMLQTSQSGVGTVTETSAAETVSDWNQVSQWSNGYPAHMVFDPQYPGWYYDTVAQEWRSIESDKTSIESKIHSQDQYTQNGFVSTDSHAQSISGSYYNDVKANSYGSQNFSGQGLAESWMGSFHENQNNLATWHNETISNQAVPSYGGNQTVDNSYSSNVSVSKDQQKPLNSFGTVHTHHQPSRVQGGIDGAVGFQGFIPREGYSQQFNPETVKQNEQTPYDYYGSQKSLTNPQQSLPAHQTSYASNIGRSSAGRPPHALVTFGFGGKLIVVKDSSSFGNVPYGNQVTVGGSISVLNLMEVVPAKNETSGIGVDASDYFHVLCHQSFPGPLVGGSVGNKELNKWIEERIANCDLTGMNHRKGRVLRLLLNLLKIGCQHYGKLRSPFGTDATSRENDIPESAVAKLFASAKREGAFFNEYGTSSQCLQRLPSEGEIRATASEVQNLLVSGRKKEALQRAQDGQLWGPALVLASQLGDQFYVDTVKQMALHQLVAGSPLRTLCLLIAGQPREVFSTDVTAGSFAGAVNNMAQSYSQLSANCMLDDWEENLAVITANRTKDDELVIIHLGDCLWKERSENTAAHICYLVAEANFESYSETARLCLIGSDHLKFPRTYASPEAIQRTELYEYSKVLGNSQFLLLPFQPYKLIYAYMLAEVGKISDSLKYCQAVLKSLKTGRAPEVETWKQLLLLLEDRIKTHQQGGYTLAPAKLMGKLLNFFDSTAHRVVGGLPPPIPSTAHGGSHGDQLLAPRVPTSQSTMAMSSLMPSASMEPISEWTADGNKMAMPNRSVSEPDFGRTPRQDHVESSKDKVSPDGQGKAADSARASRFSRFGFGSQILQKTVGLVLGPRPGRQAKLGEKNKFYYDEKLKRWVEEGAEPPAEETAPPPPPTTAAFQNGTPDYNLRSALTKEASPANGSPDFRSPPSENSSGIPPIPPSSNQFSARGRMGVRSRYVDTFNQGNASSAKLFQSPTIPSVKPAVAANAKFFIPSPVSSTEQPMEGSAENLQDTADSEPPTTSAGGVAFETLAPSSTPMQRFPSMGNIPSKGAGTNVNGAFPPSSRRTASWSGSFSDSFSPPKAGEVKPLGEVLGMYPSPPITNSEKAFMPAPINGGNFGEDLQEVLL